MKWQAIKVGVVYRGYDGKLVKVTGFNASNLGVSWVRPLDPTEHVSGRTEFARWVKEPVRNICLLCGNPSPCLTDEEGLANGGPGSPCTFEFPITKETAA